MNDEVEQPNSTLSRPARQVLPILVLAILTCAVLFLYSSWNRPIWYDEFVYFALGGLGGLSEALSAIGATTSNLNQGVTGVFMLSDYLLLKAFGAELWAMRLPSLVTGIWMVIAGAVFLRQRGVGWWGLSILPIVLVGQVTLMYYLGEARTYMPLAGAVVGALAYWSLPHAQRSRAWARILGWGSVLMGVGFHPYFAVYLPLIVVFCWFAFGQSWVATAASSSPLRAFAKFVNPALLTVAGVTYVALAWGTWLQGSATKIDLDPYLFLTDPLWKSILAQLFQFAYVSRFVTGASAVALAVVLVLAARNRGIKNLVLSIWPPVALMALSFAAAFAISLVSLSQAFWIIPRQWIGSIALATIAAIWLVVAVVQLLPGGSLRTLVTGFFVLLVVTSAAAPFQAALSSIQEFDNLPPMPESRLAELIALRESGIFPADQVWIDAAQGYIDLGGPVNAIFGEFYTGRDWNDFQLTD